MLSLCTSRKNVRYYNSKTELEMKANLEISVKLISMFKSLWGNYSHLQQNWCSRLLFELSTFNQLAAIFKMFTAQVVHNSFGFLCFCFLPFSCLRHPPRYFLTAKIIHITALNAQTFLFRLAFSWQTGNIQKHTDLKVYLLNPLNTKT